MSVPRFWNALLAFVFFACAASPAAAQTLPNSALFGDLTYRWLGPAVMGGRLDALAGVAGDPRTIYLAHSSGGLWKSTDGGLSFTSIFAGGKSLAIGAVAVDPRDPSHVYIGTGEGFPRNTAAYGDGVWMSADGGKSWKHLGLERSGSIAKIAIDPANGKIVLAAALGEEFIRSRQRGIYRSTDGGTHWLRVLHANDTTGGSDIVFDPKHPHIVYAGLFDFLRRPWSLRSGGPGSGLYKSSDAGRSWKRLSDPALHDGLPKGPFNRVGVDVCPSAPNVVYAFVPSKSGMLYRSLDAGVHWSLRSSDQNLNFRPFYFSQVRCDPADPRKVFAVGGSVMVSKDGGKTFRNAGGGGDNHDLWIDPRDPQRILNASDMGFYFSLDGAKTWTFDNVVPFAQVYRVGFDFADPYHVMGGLQDHEVWWGPNEKRSRADGVAGGDWLNIADWGDGQYAMADPRDPNIVYEDTHFGDLARADLETGERQYISPQPIIAFGTGAGSFPYRFNWSAPLLISHFNPDVLYFGGNVLFRTADRGDSWKVVSPDLMHCAPSKLARSGGPITYDNTNAESYCTIYAISEDATDPRTIWVGTDNGQLDLTRDGGASWNDLSGRMPGLPRGTWVNCVSASDTQPGVAYAVYDRHQFGDNHPYVYSTADYGLTWQNISAGLQSYVHVVREDPRNRNVLYAGTETGLFVSLDRGLHWTDFRLGMPHVPVFDLRVHPRDNDLIVGTHGRGFYVLDDLAPIQSLGAALQEPAYLFAPPIATRYAGGNYSEHGRGAFVSPNKPYGATISFYLASVPAAAPKKKPKLRLDILDASGAVIATTQTPVHAGINRTTWDLRESALPEGRVAARDPRPYYVFYPLRVEGPQVLPGTFTIRLAAPGGTLSAPLVVRMDPRHPLRAGALRAQHDAVRELATMQESAESAVLRVDDVRRQLGALRKARLMPSTQASIARLDADLTSRLVVLRNPASNGYRNPARLIEQMAYLRYTIEQYDGPPTRTQTAFIARYANESATALDRLAQPLKGELTSLNRRLAGEHAPPVIVKPQ